MGQSYELVVKHGVLTETTNGNAHTTVDVTVKTGLRTVVFFEVCNELVGRRGKIKFSLNIVAKCLPVRKDLFLGTSKAL